jgi:hypothetical protein
MSDSQTTPYPGTDPPEDETVQATQVIRTTDVTQVIRTQDIGDSTNATQAIPARDIGDSTNATQVMRIEDPSQTTQVAGDTTETEHVRETTAVKTAGENAQTDAGRPWFKRKRFAVPSAVIGVFAFIMITTGGNDSGLFRAVTHAAAPTSEVSLRPPPATATIGQSVRDGRFAFMVTGVQGPSKSLTDRFGKKQSAQGIFIIVRVNVSNIGYESRSLSATDLFLVDATGRRFATSSAISAMPGADAVFLHKINPGQSVTNAPVLFDVAPGTVATSIELHDSMTSRGVQVRLP